MTTEKLSYYSLLWSIILVVILILVRLVWGFGDTWTQDLIAPLPTQNILSNNKLPDSCLQTLQIYECMLNDSSLTWHIKANINQSYRELISQWNIIQNKETLITSCEDYYTYLLTTSEEPYQTSIVSCQEK